MDEKLVKLIDAVLAQVQEDVESNDDLTALEELLVHCPKENLIQYLPNEDEWEQYR